MGGARSVQPGLVLDLARLDAIDLRPADRVVWAGAGAILAAVDAALAPHGLAVGHDPWTYPVATVGGTISTNGLGYMGGRYGGMGDQVMGLEVALADGSLLRTPALPRRSVGPDPTRLFVGAEGTLGVITAAGLRVHTLAEARSFSAYGFESFADGFHAVDQIGALGLRPILLDYGEEHASPWPGLSARQEGPPLLHLGFEGYAEEVAAAEQRASAIVRASGGWPLAAALAETLWRDRHVIAERFARNRRRPRWPGGLLIDYIHVSLPPSAVLSFRERCHAATETSGVALLECGLWTAPELFSSILATPDAEGGRACLDAVVDDLLSQAQDLGGSMEYCHGAGVRLAHLMEREHGSGFATLRRLKAALDPAGILNPGKLGL
jgi:alkyldihydroxyacetonephosphate synthase